MVATCVPVATDCVVSGTQTAINRPTMPSVAAGRRSNHLSLCTIACSQRCAALPLVTVLLLASADFALFAQAPVDGTLVVDVLPAMLLLGMGAGMAFNSVPASLADARTTALRSAGIDPITALTSGYHVAFVVAAIFVAAAATLGAAILRS